MLCVAQSAGETKIAKCQAVHVRCMYGASLNLDL